MRERQQRTRHVQATRGALSWDFLRLKVMRCSHRHPSDPCRTQTISPCVCASFPLYCQPRRPPEHLTSAAPQSRAPSLISLLIEHIFAVVCQPIKAAILFVDSYLSSFTDCSLNRVLSRFNRDLFTNPFPNQHRLASFISSKLFTWIKERNLFSLGMFGGNMVFQNTRHIIKVPGVDEGLQLAKEHMFSPGGSLKGSVLRSSIRVENTLGSAGFWHPMINFWCRVAAHQPHEASGRTWPGLVTLRAAARAFQSKHVTWGKSCRSGFNDADRKRLFLESFPLSYTNI